MFDKAQKTSSFTVVKILIASLTFAVFIQARVIRITQLQVGKPGKKEAFVEKAFESFLSVCSM